MYTERKNAHLAGPKPEALHPTLQALLQKYLTMELPPLPPLSGPIANTWRSHTSYKGVRHQTHEEPEGSKANDYERMEFMGDSLLTLTVKLRIDEVYPRLTPETRTFLHDALVNNQALSLLSVAYKLPTRLLADPTLGHSLSMTPSIQADLFEAYIGASHEKNGRNLTMRWVQEVFDPLIVAGYEDRLNIWQAEMANPVSAGGVTQETYIIDPDADVIVYPKHYLVFLNQWCQRERHTLGWVRSTEIAPNAGQCWVDGEKRAELIGGNGEKWKSVQEKMAKAVLEYFDVDI